MLKGRLIKFLSFFILLCVILEIVLRFGLHIKPEGPVYKIEPEHFLQFDSLLGWTNGLGSRTVFRTCCGDKLFEFSTDKDGNRISSPAQGKVDLSKSKKTIQLYGCSYTFGFAIPDTTTSGYVLQHKLNGTDYTVINKGVPGYGLAQMFRSLQESLLKGDTPTIAVFNYAWFHDLRSPLYEQYCGSMFVGLGANNAKEFEGGSFPYYDLIHDSLKFFLVPFSQLSKNWPGTQYSSLLIVLNQIYRIGDDSRIPHLHEINSRLAIEMMNYCYQHHIKAIFAEIPSTRDMPPDFPSSFVPSLKNRGYNALIYPIDIGDEKYHSNLDAGHPNELAHMIFAETLYSNFVQKGWITPQ